jgi:hypothetical protein
MDAAALLVQVDTLAVRFVSEHQCSGNVRMTFRLITFSQVFYLESDGIALAAKSAAATRNFPHLKFLCQHVFLVVTIALLGATVK